MALYCQADHGAEWFPDRASLNVSYAFLPPAVYQPLDSLLAVMYEQSRGFPARLLPATRNQPSRLPFSR